MKAMHGAHLTRLVLLFTLFLSLFAAPPLAAAEGFRPASPEGAGTLLLETVSAGKFNTCGIKSDGTIVCWGEYSAGQSTPPAGTFLQVNTGEWHSCAIKSDGTVACWGPSDFGEASPPAGTFSQVSAGAAHTCGIKSDGTLVCWGWNAHDQLTLPAGTFSQVSAGAYHTCGLRSDGTIACWGANWDGQSMPPDGTFSQISAGWWNNCGIRSDGTIACWGANGAGQSTPPAGTFSQVSAGAGHACGIKSDGTVVCWGRNEYGQSTPPAGTFLQVGAGYSHTCGIKSDGTITCWGWKDYGQSTPPAGVFGLPQVSLGVAHSCERTSDGQLTCWGDNRSGKSTPPALAFSQVSAGGEHTCGIKSDGAVACWGDNEDGQSTPPDGTFSQVSAGADHTCGIRSNGLLACWGYNGYGQSTPPAGTFLQVSAGGHHNCGIRSDNTLACWGDNFYGQSTPPAGTFSQVSTGTFHTCGIKSDGTLACWGTNAYGQTSAPSGTFLQVSTGAYHTCGVRSDGTLACWGEYAAGQSTPPDGTFSQVSAGTWHTCGIKSDGLLACWGDNTFGQANIPPQINEGASSTVTMSKDGNPTPFSLTLHASDPDSATLTWSIATPASHGTASASGTGTTKSIGYTPAANNTDGDSFVVQVTDDQGLADRITVNVIIQRVNVLVSIAGNIVGDYDIEQQHSQRYNYTDANNGPVQVTALDGDLVIPSERVIYQYNGSAVSYSEMIGFPASQLTNKYWFPWYNNVNMWTQLRFANPSTSQAANVKVYLGTQQLWSYSLGPSASVRKDFPGVNGGPLRIESNINIIAVERVIYSAGGQETSYSEIMAFPDNQLTTQYWIPWYNNVNMWTQLRFANPSATLSTNVKVYLGNQLLWSYDLAPLASVRKDFPNVNGGPLQIISTQKVLAAERVIYSEGGVQRGVETSYSELMAIPGNQLDNAYIFPSYTYPDSSIWGQLRLANPSPTQSTTVKVYLGNELLTTYPLGPLASLRTDYLGRDSGPLKVVSTNGTIIAAMRVIMKVNNVDTSYTEVSGYPVNQLTNTYYFPWYNNYNFDTQLKIAVP
jgi:alpha-tubulin suppressor-like RCC1 family protein